MGNVNKHHAMFVKISLYESHLKKIEKSCQKKLSIKIKNCQKLTKKLLLLPKNAKKNCC